MRTQILTLAAGVLLAACAPIEAEPPAMPPSGEPTQCKAEHYQRYIGRNRSELPPKPAGETWRVTCDTCAVTMDFNPNRLNIVYDTGSGVIEQVKCG